MAARAGTWATAGPRGERGVERAARNTPTPDIVRERAPERSLTVGGHLRWCDERSPDNAGPEAAARRPFECDVNDGHGVNGVNATRRLVPTSAVMPRSDSSSLVPQSASRNDADSGPDECEPATPSPCMPSRQSERPIGCGRSWTGVWPRESSGRGRGTTVRRDELRQVYEARRLPAARALVPPFSDCIGTARLSGVITCGPYKRRMPAWYFPRPGEAPGATSAGRRSGTLAKGCAQGCQRQAWIAPTRSWAWLRWSGVLAKNAVVCDKS